MVGLSLLQKRYRLFLGDCMGGMAKFHRSHQVNLIPLDDQIYMIDIGFGNQGPTRPMPLIDGHVSKWGATEAETRVTYKQGSKPWVQGLWTYQHRNSPKDTWTQIYHFVGPLSRTRHATQ